MLFLNSHSVISNCLWNHGLQSPLSFNISQIYSNSCPLSWWYHSLFHPVIPFSSCLRSFQQSEPFLMSWLLALGSQSIGASVSAPVLSMNIEYWFYLGLTGLIFWQSNGLSRVSSNTTVQKDQFLCSAFFIVQLSSIHSHPYMTTGKKHSFD